MTNKWLKTYYRQRNLVNSQDDGVNNWRPMELQYAKDNGFINQLTIDPFDKMDYNIPTTDEENIIIVSHLPEYIKKIKNPSEEMQKKAINKDSNAIQFIENPTEAIQIAVLRIVPNIIDKIKNTTPLTREFAKLIYYNNRKTDFHIPIEQWTKNIARMREIIEITKSKQFGVIHHEATAQLPEL